MEEGTSCGMGEEGPVRGVWEEGPRVGDKDPVWEVGTLCGR